MSDFEICPVGTLAELKRLKEASMTPPDHTPSEAHTPLKLPLSYRTREHDDWGTIRDADLLPVLRARLFLSEQELWQHRIDGTDPYEEFSLSIITAVNERPKLLERVRVLEALLDATADQCQKSLDWSDKVRDEWHAGQREKPVQEQYDALNALVQEIRAALKAE